MGSHCLMGIQFQFGMMKVLEMDRSDGCKTIQVYLIPLNFTRKILKMVYFKLCGFSYNKNWIKEESNKWGLTLYLRIGRFNIVKMLILPNMICRFKAIPVNILASSFVNIEKLILKFMWKSKRLRIANTILNENNEVKGLTLSDFKTYHKPIVIKTLWHW